MRPYLGKARGYMSMSAGLSTVAAERVIDGLTRLVRANRGH